MSIKTKNYGRQVEIDKRLKRRKLENTIITKTKKINNRNERVYSNTKITVSWRHKKLKKK